MKRHVRGFTIVELSIVILVIGILATVVVVGYRGSQDRAHDLQIRDAATQVADQIQLFASNAGHFPRGGYGSTTAIGAGTECIDGASGWFGSSIYTCTVENTLVASGYLPSGFSVRLPQMPGYSAGTSIRGKCDDEACDGVLLSCFSDGCRYRKL